MSHALAEDHDLTAASHRGSVDALVLDGLIIADAKQLRGDMSFSYLIQKSMISMIKSL
jgi:hypothetical protein